VAPSGARARRRRRAAAAHVEHAAEDAPRAHRRSARDLVGFHAVAGQLQNARGEVGADDPALAVEDALRTFGADEIVVAGDEEMASSIRERVTIPVSRA